jgi:hypothetical protein
MSNVKRGRHNLHEGPPGSIRLNSASAALVRKARTPGVMHGQTPVDGLPARRLRTAARSDTETPEIDRA